jgi:hypothetical protein
LGKRSTFLKHSLKQRPVMVLGQRLRIVRETIRT